MEGILIVLIALAIICFAGRKVNNSGGGTNIKDAPKTKKPKIQPAPQPKIK
jgi:hypothetical protein